MKTSNTYYLDRLETIIYDVKRTIVVWDHDETIPKRNLEEVICSIGDKPQEETLIGILENELDYHHFAVGLRHEIRQNYIAYRESKLQDRYGRSLLAYLPRTFNLAEHLSTIHIELESTNHIANDLEFLGSWVKFFSEVYEDICNEMRVYSPEIYGPYEENLMGPTIDAVLLDERFSNKHKSDLRKYINGLWPANTTQPQPPQPGVELQWKGDKTDLAELIWALSKSGRITDTSTGKDVTQKELAGQIATLLGMDSLDIANLMKGRYGTASKSTSYKAQDGKTFINELQKLLDSRILD